MRRFDKDKNMVKANLLVESRYINRGLLNETPWNGNPESNRGPFDNVQEVELYGLKDVTIILPFNGEYSIDGETSGNGSFSLSAEDLASIFPKGYESIKAFGIEVIKTINSHEINQPHMVTINASKLRELPHYNDIEGYMSYYFDNGLDYNDITYNK